MRPKRKTRAAERRANHRKTKTVKAYIRACRDMKPCTDCGVAYPWFVMQFDHRNPADKANDIKAACFRTIPAVQREMAKCDLVCANCHAARTHHTKAFLYRREPKQDEPNPQLPLLH